MGLVLDLFPPPLSCEGLCKQAAVGDTGGQEKAHSMCQVCH